MYPHRYPLHAQLAEIDENLCRAELTPTQEAEHLARRKEIWEALQSEQVVPVESKREDGRGHRHEEFAAATATATGQSKQDINRKTRRATEVCQEARDLIRGTKLDTGTFLDRLAKAAISDREQVDRVREALAALADKERAQIWSALNPNLEVAQLAPLQDCGHGGARPHPKEFAADT